VSTGGQLGNSYTAILRDLDAGIQQVVSDALLRAKTIEGFKQDIAITMLLWVYSQYPGVPTESIAQIFPGLSIEDHRTWRGYLAGYYKEVTDWLELQHLKKMPYADYLASDHWTRVRDAARDRAGYRCQVCNSSGDIHVHHRSYERRGEESDADLTVLCADCHKLFHDNSRVVR
jgi:hypothetical protein